MIHVGQIVSLRKITCMSPEGGITLEETQSIISHFYKLGLIIGLLHPTLVIDTWQLTHATCMTTNVIHHVHMHPFSVLSFSIMFFLLLVSYMYMYWLLELVCFVIYDVYSSQKCCYWKACVLGTLIQNLL